MKWYAILAACFIVGASGESLFELFSNLYYQEKFIFNFFGKFINLFVRIVRTECESGLLKHFTHELGLCIPAK